MKTTKEYQKHNYGSLYIVDKMELQKSILAIRKEYVIPSYQLKDGIIQPNFTQDNHRFAFDFLGDLECYGASCKGFLYPDSKFIGLIRYTAESNWPPEHIRGVYSIKKSRIIIRGEWEGVKGDKSFYWLDLGYRLLQKL